MLLGCYNIRYSWLAIQCTKWLSSGPVCRLYSKMLLWVWAPVVLQPINLCTDLRGDVLSSSASKNHTKSLYSILLSALGLSCWETFLFLSAEQTHINTLTTNTICCCVSSSNKAVTNTTSQDLYNNSTSLPYTKLPHRKHHYFVITLSKHKSLKPLPCNNSG